MQFIKIMIPLCQESNSKAENELRIEFPQVVDEITSYARHGLCSAVKELITIAMRLADQDIRIQLAGAAPSSKLLHLAGLTGLCPEKNRFLFERFLETNSKDPREGDFVLAGYSLFGHDRILAVLDQLEFGIRETEKGLLASKTGRTEGESQLILLVRAKGLSRNAIPAIEKLANDRSVFERLATGDTKALSMKGPFFTTSEYTLSEISKEKPGSLKELSELLAHSEKPDEPRFQEDQMTGLVKFSSIGHREAYFLIRDIAKNGVNPQSQTCQAEFIDAAARNKKSSQESVGMMRTIGPRVLPCKSHCYAEAIEIIETVNLL